MKRSILLALSLLATLSLAGCAVDTAEENDTTENVAEAEDALTASSGVTVQATYSTVYLGTQTYGSTSTPILNIRVTVDDKAIRNQFPSFDGMETAFALVPFLKNGALVWESQALKWTGTTFTGYYADIRLDVHESNTVYNVDWSTLSANGIAVGLNTNVGTIWTQQPGQNWPVLKK